MRTALLVTVLGLSGVAACSTYRDDLLRSREAFEQNSYDRALGLLRAIEDDTSYLSVGERAQYAYLRGMTDYRLGYKADARHWLLVCKTIDDAARGSLGKEWRARLDEVLGELNEAVYAGGGAHALENKRTEGDESKPKAKKSVDEP
jgi:hypothetical protein